MPFEQDLDLRYLVGGSLQHSNSDGPVSVFCPFHNDSSRPSFAIYPDHGYCFTCGTYERYEDLLLRLSGNGEQGLDLSSVPRRVSGGRDSGNGTRVSTSTSTQQLEIFSHVYFYHRFLNECAPEKARYYLNRGILPDTIDRYKLGFSGAYFCLPVWEGDTIHGIKFRVDPDSLLPEKPKYRNTKGMKNSIFRPNPRGKHFVITEGEFDALVVSQYGYDAVSATSGATSVGVFKRFSQTEKKVFILTDKDESGDDAADKLAKVFPTAKRVALPEGQDISDVLKPLGWSERRMTVQSLIGGN